MSTRADSAVGFIVLVAAAAWACAACTCGSESAPDEAPAANKAGASATEAPKVLYLPDGGAGAIASSLPSAPGALLAPRTRCPPEMVDVGGAFCIDRYEVSLVDAKTNKPLSPYYHPTRGQTRASFRYWERARAKMGPARARVMAIPVPPDWQLDGSFEPKAISERGVVPSGYLSRETAERACTNAAKRLCTTEEWVSACRGFQGRKYPYGHEYAYLSCNVFRTAHPANLLHGNASIGHLDPRLNQVAWENQPLLSMTGDFPDCKSEWGSDAAYDMVGNLDEWVDDPDGVFLGGFYSRGTKDGCDSRIESHPPEYFDYSLGTRCCL